MKLSRPRSKPPEENTCSDCLYFQPRLGVRRPIQGNCTHYKEWIERASLTTCSEMSVEELGEGGIYRLLSDGENGWLYARREGKVRTRLFPVAGRQGSGKVGRKGPGKTVKS